MKEDTSLPNIIDTQTPAKNGRKFDAGKPQYSLLPLKALEEITEVLTAGAIKYERDNWKYVPDAQNRYFDATFRHLISWRNGEQLDPETGKNHLAHAMCCLMFILERDIYTPEDWDKRVNK